MDPYSMPLVGRFRSAYEYRAHISSTEEHFADGLTGALATALELYTFEPEDRCREQEAAVTREFRDDLLEAVSQLVEDRPATLARFFLRLGARGLDPASIEQRTLKDQLVVALERYCDNWSVGLGTGI